MKWARSLILQGTDSVEKRLERVLSYIFSRSASTRCQIIEIDATGGLGNAITKQLNQNGHVLIDFKKIIQLFDEEGQIIELDLHIREFQSEYRFIVRRGQHIDIISDQDIPDKILGDYTDLDISYFEPGED